MRLKDNKPALALVIAIVLVGLLFVGLLIYKGVSAGAGAGTGTQIEQEDCDAEDFRNREADCGFIQTKKPVPAKTTKGTAPKPATTRRK